MNPNDLSQVTDAQLEQMIAAKQQENPFIQSSTPNNMAIAASKGLAAGLQSAATAPGLLLRSFTDKLGFTDPDVTAGQRQANVDLKQRAAQAGIELDAPVSAKAGELLGEIAPTFALGGAALSGGKALLGAGRIADIGANVLSGAITSGVGDTGGDLSKNAQNALLGGLTGGALAGVAQGAGKLLQGKFGGDLDTQAMQAFKEAGIRPRASQVIKQAGTEHASPAWEGIENTLNKIPLFGIRGQVKSGAKKGADLIRNTISELDDVTPKAPPMFQTFVNSMDNTKGYSLNNVQRAIADSMKSLGHTKGVKSNPEVMDYLSQLKNDFSTPTNFRDLVTARHGIDSAINSVKRNLNNPASREDFAALAHIRNRVSVALEAMARQNGAVRSWQKINQVHQERLFMDGITRAREAATADGGRTFNLKTFSHQLDDELNFMQKDMKLAIPTVQKRGIENLKKLSNILSSDNVRPGTPGASITLGSLGAGAGIAVAGSSAVPLLGVSAAISKGLSLMATTKFGIERIARLGKVTPHNPNVRQLVGAALAIGQADEARQTEQLDRNNLSKLSDEDLDRLIQMKQQGGQ